MKPTKKYFSVVMYIILYKVAQNFKLVDEILKFQHSYEKWAILPRGAWLLSVHITRWLTCSYSAFEGLDEILHKKASNSTF